MNLGRGVLGSTARSQTLNQTHERTKTVMMTRRTNAPVSRIAGLPLAFTRCMALLMFLAAAQLTPPHAVALDAPAKPRPPFIPPLPPVRPAGPAGVPLPAQSPPAPASPAGFPLPAQSLPAPAGPAMPSEAPASFDNSSAQAQNLPPASRARMHECAREWQKMKASGAAADKIWFDFAKVCLTK